MEKVNGLLLKNIFTKFYEKKKITNFLIVFIFFIKVVSKLSWNNLLTLVIKILFLNTFNRLNLILNISIWILTNITNIFGWPH